MLDQYRTINIDLCAQANIPYINMRQAFVDAVPSSFHGYSGYVVNQFIPPSPPPSSPSPLTPLCALILSYSLLYNVCPFTCIHDHSVVACHTLLTIYPSVQPCIKVSYHRWRA